ncbi:OmpA family protein [Colwellia sp. Bg11-28]|uniref:OmpA family protein n=1 Tax=Colwellia sp. Bg11-28 TaxID=2058305 RepID=UPI000C347FC2|nr:OmpA family protein [Colwellia sp. Bg11-28]PKH88522.1 hypothetical protein CXF79_03850 [Colwellia sp. Bg11-28]
MKNFIINRHLKSLLVIVITLMSAFGSAAEDQWQCRYYNDMSLKESKLDPCFYIGLGAGVSYLDPNENDTNWFESGQNDIGYKVFGGFRFSEDWFGELQFVDLGKVKYQNINPNLGQNGINYNVSTLYAGYYVPFDRWFNVDMPFNFYFKAGISAISNSTDGAFIQFKKESKAQLALGTGLEYAFADNWMLQGDIESFDRDAAFISLSVVYRFGSPLEVVKPLKVRLKPTLVTKVDSDRDGVQNSQDLCSDTPVGIQVNSKGCAVFQGILRNVTFTTNSTLLNTNSFAALDKVVEALIKYPMIQLDIQGHTDSVFTSAYNLWLSEHRAKSISNYLIKKGIDKDRFTLKWYGELMPVASNKTSKGRALNRRVVFKVINIVEEKI